MADFDTKVLYLETPPLSAPKTSYTIGVRMKNLGVADAVCSGYVQVFDKDTGLLVKTYSVESAVIAPDEEKQAFATEVWDLTDEVVGKQFILSGAISSPGDTVPENDILNPTTVTVVAGDPPDPPAVTPHKTQHEDGGSDELNVEGLFGTLATPQPIADHATSHEEGGGDELTVGNLHGELADPQPPKVHDNDEHSEDFATEPEVATAITVHNAQLNPHGAAENIERPANKGQADGYLGLDGGAVAIPLQLGFKTGPDLAGSFLQGNKIWTAPVGGCVSLNIINPTPASGEVTLGQLLTGQFWIEGALGETGFDARVFGRVDNLTPGDTVTFRFYAWPTAGGATPALHVVTWTAQPTDNNVTLRADMRAVWDPTNNNIVGFGSVLALDVGGGPNAEGHVMPAETLTAWWNPIQEQTVYTTIQLTGATITGHNFNSNLMINHLMEYLT